MTLAYVMSFVRQNRYRPRWPSKYNPRNAGWSACLGRGSGLNKSYVCEWARLFGGEGGKAEAALLMNAIEKKREWQGISSKSVTPLGFLGSQSQLQTFHWLLIPDAGIHAQSLLPASALSVCSLMQSFCSVPSHGLPSSLSSWFSSSQEPSSQPTIVHVPTQILTVS